MCHRRFCEKVSFHLACFSSLLPFALFFKRARSSHLVRNFTNTIDSQQFSSTQVVHLYSYRATQPCCGSHQRLRQKLRAFPCPTSLWFLSTSNTSTYQHHGFLPWGYRCRNKTRRGLSAVTKNHHIRAKINEQVSSPGKRDSYFDVPYVLTRHVVSIHFQTITESSRKKLRGSGRHSPATELLRQTSTFPRCATTRDWLRAVKSG
jgi:hypothetical protein